MDFRILGPLEVHGDRGAIDVPGRKPRAVLAVLLLHANEPVSAERLAVALWGREAPAGAIRTVHVNVSRLRKALGAGDILTTTPAGYRLRVDPGELDADRFERLVSDGRRALERGQVDDAGTLLREALALWRGPPLADLAFEPFAQAEIARLEEQHEAALEARVEADLAAGRHGELVGELRRLAAEYPARERLAGQLMLALYRCGRQGDALEAYREARRRLADELGVEPGAELRALQEAILHHDPALALDRVRGELPHELDAAAAPPLVGRESELAWLRDRWAEASAGRGRLIALAGTVGMGKSRLAAELASEVHETGASVLYASGAGPARAVHEVLERSRSARRPLLLIVDDADQAPADVLAAVRDVAGGPVLVLATASDHEALDALEPGVVLFLDLDRLGPAAVAKIAALYVPDDQTADVLPAEWLLGASAGVPQRVHDVASQWARERIGAAAGRAAAGRSRLRSMEDELAGGVVQLQSVREWRERPEDGEQRVVCPFKGLASFEAADAPYFFGRERLVAELVARLVGAPLLGVVGPSGSGKSSVVRAGLLPALASGVLPGSEQWPQRVIRPGEHPLRQLQEAIAGAPPADRFVLAVDQFEETFTVCRDEQERAAFIAGLARAASGESGGVVVVAVRADFYGRCAEYPELSRLLSSNHVLVGPMQPEELRRAITCPAQRVGLTVEDELAERIVRDVQDAPGALPLLSTALLELWRRRDGRRLRLAAYQDTGGVRGAVARLAEDAYERLGEGQRELARGVLLQLVEVDDEGSEERLRLGLDELATGEDVGRLLDVLADRRLVTLSEGTVELAHEALLREWPRLRGWIDESRDDMRIGRTLRSAAREWERVGRDEGALHRGARLAEAREWAERAVSLGELERAFLRASEEHERRHRRARRRTLTLAFAGLAFGFVAIAAVAVVAIEQRQDAIDERTATESRQLAGQSGLVSDADPEASLRLAISAFDTARTDQAATALREATLGFRQVGAVKADSVDAWTAAYNADGTRLVTGGDDSRATVWDAATGRELAAWEAGHDALKSARFSPDGQAIALGFEDGAVVLTGPGLEDPRTVLDAGGVVSAVAFSGDGGQLAVAAEDGTVRVVAPDGSAPPRTLGGGHDGAVTGVDFSADGTRIVSADEGAVVLWRLPEGSSQALHRELGSWDAAFSPDGKLILSVGDDGWIRRFDGETGAALGRTAGEGAELYTVAFSQDGSHFAAGGEDGLIRVWSAAGGPSVAVLRGQRSRVYDLSYGAERDRLASAADDGAARIWNPVAAITFEVPGDAWLLDFSPDGKQLAASDRDGVVRRYDAATGEELGRAGGPAGNVVGEFSAVSDAIVVAGAGPTVRLWPSAADRAATELRVPGAEAVVAANFDPQEQRVVYVVDESRIVVRDLDSGEEVALEGGTDSVYDAQFSPDGERVAAYGEDGVLRIWRVDEPARPESELGGHRDGISGINHAADGRILTAGVDGTARVWPPAGRGRPVVLRGHTNELTGAAFTPDGSKVLTTSHDGSLRVWDSRSGVMLARLAESDLELDHVAVSRDGTIAYLDDEEVVRIIRCEVCGDLDDVRALAQSRRARQLSADERQRYAATAG